MALALVAAQEGDAGGQQRVGQPPAARYPHAAVADKGALSLFGPEDFILDGIVDDAGDHLAAALQRDRHREMRQAVQEIRGPVQRVDDPAAARGRRP